MKGLKKIILYLLMIGGSALLSQPSNNDFANAIDVSSLIGSCSRDAVYDNSSATAGGSNGSCFGSAGQLAGNMWFSFVATASGEMSVTVDIGGTKGSMERARVAIWESDGTTELACNAQTGTTDASTTASGLTSGNTYYISVDNRTGSKAGTYTLCLDDGNGSAATNDEFVDAYDVTSLIGTCSSNALYDNTGATADGTSPSCYSNSFNLWFKFTAPSSGNIQITVDIGGIKGTMQRAYISLWESDGTTELSCAAYVGQSDDVTLVHSGLTPGNTYYVAVDNNNATKSGSFTLCLDALDIFYSIADGNWNSASTWSHGGNAGTATTLTPGANNIVHIQGHDVIVATAGACDSLLIDASTDQTSLTLNANLTIGSNFWIQNTGNNVDCFVTIQSGATLSASNVYFNRQGGANLFSASVSTSSSLTTGNLYFNTNGGTTNNSLLTLDDATLTVTGNLTFNGTSGVKAQLTADKTSSISVANNIVFNNSGAGLGEIELNNSATLSIGGNFTRTSSYGIFDMNGTSTLTFNGSSSQTFPTIFGSGGDAFSYYNVVINNTSGVSPQISTDGIVYVYGNLNLTDGVISSTSANKLFVMDNGTTSNGSSASYVTGPMTKVGDESFEFPLGLNGDFAPISMSAPSSASDFFTAEYFQDNPGSIYDASSKDANIESLSTNEYWTLDRDLGSSSVSVTLSRASSRSDSLSTINNYLICRWNGTTWQDHGNASYTGDYSSGTVTSIAISSFSPFTFGKTANPTILPVELLSFDVENNEKSVDLNWVTLSEIDNDYFEVQRTSIKGDWKTIGVVNGNGTTTDINEYNFSDDNPLEGVSYYRFRQVDFNGEYEYSMVRSIYFKESINSSVSIFPNPAKDKIIISGVESSEIIRIFNVMGQEMDVKSYNVSEMNQSIDISALINGTYLVYVNGDVSKLIKQ